MKWEDRRRSSNVNRGSKAPLAVGGGIGGLVIMLILYFIGVDPSVITNNNQQYQENTQIESSEVSKERETLEDFLSVILADTEDVWNDKFKEANANYEEPQMTLFQETTQTDCGVAQSRMGPFIVQWTRQSILMYHFIMILKRSLVVAAILLLPMF